LFVSLEKIFIDERIYKDKEFENARSIDIALKHIDMRIEPFKNSFIREITKDDLLKLLEIRMARILKFNTDKASDNIAQLKDKLKEVEHKIAHIIDHTIEWFKYLKKTYGKDFPRMTEIRNFENIEITKVVEANSKLFVNREEGFIGTNFKKDDNVEFVQNCSDIDDVIVFLKNGKYKVVKVSEKQFVGKDIEHLAVYKRNDQRTIFNAIYRDGKNGSYYIKRFFVSGVTRDKEYDLTSGKPDSKLVYFSANPNGEAETVKIQLKPTSRRIKKMAWEVDFSQIMIKGRASRGNLLTKFPIAKVVFKREGGSTLGGTHIWFDRDVLKLNQAKRGDYLGEFFNDDMILVVLKNGDFYTSNFDLTNHYDDDILIIEKFEQEKVWSTALFDAEQGFYYIKRFKFEPSTKRTSFIGENEKSNLLLLSDEIAPQFKVEFGGKNKNKETLIIDVEHFIGEKSYKAKGKRISTYEIAKIGQLAHEPENSEEENDFDEIIEEEKPEIPVENIKVQKVDKQTNTEKPQIVGSPSQVVNPDEPAKPTLIYDKDNPEWQMSLF